MNETSANDGAAEPAELHCPGDLEETLELVRKLPRLLAVGQRTKRPQSRVAGTPLVAMSKLNGIIEYEPSEFTFTAWAGTKVTDIVDVLLEQNQYLPFDPILQTTGCTLGGTVASGGSGPGRARYGGLRDFLLGVQLVTGEAEIINVGGKVVKNAAGFDIPKLLVGSLGRYGIMTAMTFKVFPKPVERRTYRISDVGPEEATEKIAFALTSRWELDAAEYESGSRQLHLRLAGPGRALDSLGDELKSVWPESSEEVDGAEAQMLWARFDALDDPSEEATVIKIAATLDTYRRLEKAFVEKDEVSLRLSAAGAVVWLTDETGNNNQFIDRTLTQLGLTGLAFRGECDRIWFGRRRARTIDAAIKHALDPIGRFPDLDPALA